MREKADYNNWYKIEEIKIQIKINMEIKRLQ